MLDTIVACAVAIGHVAPAAATTLRINDAAPAPPAPAALPAPAVPAAPPLVLGVGERAQVKVDAGVWLARLTGTARVGSAGTTFDLNRDLAVEDMGPGVAGEFAVWCDRWRFAGVGLTSGVNETETAPTTGVFGSTPITAGDTIRGEYSLWMAGGEVGYTVWRPFADEPWPWSDTGANRDLATRAIGTNGRPLFDMRVVVLGGGLVMGYDQTLQNVTTGSTSGFDKTVGVIYGGGGAEFDIGLDGRVPVLQDLRIYGYGGVGPSIPDGDVVWFVRVGLAAMVTPNIGIEVGYRLFDFTLQEGPSEIDGGVRGFFAGVAVKF